MGLTGTETILIHSSMKAIGVVEGGADTVLDVCIAGAEFCKPIRMQGTVKSYAQIGLQTLAENEVSRQ